MDTVAAPPEVIPGMQSRCPDVQLDLRGHVPDTFLPWSHPTYEGPKSVSKSAAWQDRPSLGVDRLDSRTAPPVGP